MMNCKCVTTNGLKCKRISSDNAYCYQHKNLILKNFLIQIRAYLTTGFTDEGYKKLTKIQQNKVILELKNKLSKAVDDFAKFLAEEELHPNKIEQDAYREWMEEFGMYKIMNKYRKS